MTGARLLAASATDEAEAVWRALEDQVEGHGLMCSWDWTTAWLAQWGGVVEHWFGVVEDESRTLGAFLLTRQRSGARWERHRIHVGTAGEPRGETIYIEANRLLAVPGAREAVAAGLAQLLPRLPRHDGLAIDGFVPEDARALAAATDLELRRDRAPYADLAAIRAGEGDVVSALRLGVRRRVRQSLRAFGELQTEWAQTPAQATDILEELIVLHTRRWRAEGVPGAFAAARTAAFHRALAPAFAADGRAMLLRVRAGDRTVGCLYGHIDGAELLFYQSGFGDFADNRLRPGLVTHVLAMQACLERGLGVYDFLAGEARYKDELASAERSYVWGGPRPGLTRRVLTPLVRLARSRLRS